MSKILIDPPKALAPPDSPPLWFDRNGKLSGPVDGIYRGDPDGWIMGHRERVTADEPTYGLQAVEEVDVLARIVVAMHAAGYWPRP